MKRALIFVLAASSCVFAQEGANAVFFNQSAGPVTAVGMGAFEKAPAAPIQGAPYSAAITNELIETLPDGNRIVQTSNGTVLSAGEKDRDNIVITITPQGNSTKIAIVHVTSNKTE